VKKVCLWFLILLAGFWGFSEELKIPSFSLQSDLYSQQLPRDVRQALTEYMTATENKIQDLQLQITVREAQVASLTESLSREQEIQREMRAQTRCIRIVNVSLGITCTGLVTWMLIRMNQ